MSEAQVSNNVSNNRRLLRLALGGVTLAGERLVTVVRRAEQLRAADPAPDASSDPAAVAVEALSIGSASRPAARHVVIGALVQMPSWLAGISQRIAPLPRAARATMTRGLRPFGFLARSAPARRIGRRLHVMRESLASRSARWGRMGLEEERCGRITAARAFHELSTRAMTVVADSPDLREVISEQTGGLTRSALASLREQSQRADDLSESTARKLLPHRRLEPAEEHPPERLEFHGPRSPHPAR